MNVLCGSFNQHILHTLDKESPALYTPSPGASCCHIVLIRSCTVFFSLAKGLGSSGLITLLLLKKPLIHHFPRKCLIPVLLFHISADK